MTASAVGPARCANCAGTGTDSTLATIDPYPIYLPHPCGYCQGQDDQGEAEMTDEENDISATRQCCCAGCAGMGPCDRDAGDDW